MGITPLETHTRGEHLYAAIKEMLRNRGIDLKQVVSVTTEGGKREGDCATDEREQP